MVTKVVPGLLIATPDAAQAAREACNRITKTILDAIRDRGHATIALSGGGSPLETYRLLAGETIDWNKVHVYWVDERAVPPTHERSNYCQAKQTLLDPAAIPPANIHRMRGEASDIEQAAKEYETELRDTVRSKLGGLPSRASIWSSWASATTATRPRFFQANARFTSPTGWSPRCLRRGIARRASR